MGNARKIVADVPRHAAAEQLTPARADELIHQAGISATIEGALELIPTKPVQAKLRELTKRRGEITVQLQASVKHREDALHQLEELRKKLRDLGRVGDPEDLESTIAEIHKHGDLEAVLVRNENKVKAAQATVEPELKSLTLWAGAADDLKSLAIPTPATVSRFIKEFAAAAKSLSKLEDQLVVCRDKIASIEAKLLKRTKEFNVIDADLSTSREHRERGWVLLRRCYIENEEPAPNEIEAFSAGTTLPEAYEISVKNSDEVADQLRAHSQQLADKASLDEELSTQRALAEELEKKLAEGRLHGAELSKQWTSLWALPNAQPLPPDEMAQWIDQRAKVLERIAEAQRAVEELEETRSEVQSASARLEESLDRYGEAPKDGPLSTLLSHAERVAKRMRSGINQQAILEERIQAAENAHGDAEQTRKRAEKALADWQEEWSVALKVLGKSPQTSTAELEALLEIYADLQKNLSDLGEANRRVEAMDGDLIAFGDRVGAVVALLDFHSPSAAPIEISEELERELSSAQQAFNLREKLDALLERANGELKDAANTIAVEEENLTRLCREAGCTSTEELPRFEQLSERKRQLFVQLKKTDHDLVSNGNGKTLEELIAESRGADPNEVAAAL